MKRAFLVTQREYLENVRTKGFWIGILIMPVMLVMAVTIPFIVESTREAKRYAVIDHSDWLLPVVAKKIEVADFAIFLHATSQLGGPPANQLPAALLEFSNLIQALDDEQLDAVAFRILSSLAYEEDFDHVDLPARLEQYIRDYGVQMAAWWSSKTAAEKAEFSPRISTNHFIFVEQVNKDTQQLNKLISDEYLFAYFIIGPDPIRDSNGSKYISKNLTDKDLLNWFGGYVSRQIRKDRLRQEDIEQNISNWIQQPLIFEGIQISRDGEEEQVSTDDVVYQWAPVVFVYLLWISILINTQMLLTNTIEEKSNKLIEVLLSSISPIELMAGKILGIAATGLTIIGTWVLMILSFLVFLPLSLDIALPFDLSTAASDPWFLASFLMYFILGYLLYAAILVGLGSVCNSLKEAQNLMLPVQLVQMIPIIVMVPIGRDPNGLLAQILSYIPPLTPFVMMNRAAAPPTTYEYVVTTLLLLVSIAAALWAAAKIFRIGILLTGKPPSVTEIFRWLRAPVAPESEAADSVKSAMKT